MPTSVVRALDTTTCVDAADHAIQSLINTHALPHPLDTIVTCRGGVLTADVAAGSAADAAVWRAALGHPVVTAVTHPHTTHCRAEAMWGDVRVRVHHVERNR